MRAIVKARAEIYPLFIIDFSTRRIELKAARRTQEEEL